MVLRILIPAFAAMCLFQCTPFYAALLGADSGPSDAAAALLALQPGSSASESPAETGEQTRGPRIFLTASQPLGDMSGAFSTCTSLSNPIERADCICANDSRRPDQEATFKAVLAGGSRVATTGTCVDSTCPGRQDWVLAPGTTYRSTEGLAIFSTDASALFNANSDIHNPLLFDGSGGTATQYWSGLFADWTKNSSNCLDWDDATATQFGAVGQTGSVNQSFIDASGAVSCANDAGPAGAPVSRLLCAEQI